MADDPGSMWCVATKDHHLFLSAAASTVGPVFQGFANAARFSTADEARRRCEQAQDQLQAPDLLLTIARIAEIEQQLAEREQRLEYEQFGRHTSAAANRHVTDLAALMVMVEDVREIRVRICDPEAGLNPRYMALSNVIAYLNETIDDVQAEG